MKKYRFLSIVILVFCLFLSSCGLNKENYLKKESEFGSVKIQGYLEKDINGDSEYVSLFNTAIFLTTYYEIDSYYHENIKEEFIRLHKLFDSHHYYFDSEGKLINNLRVINEEQNKEIIIDKDLIEIFKEGIRFTKLSRGKFNISVGKLASLWNHYIGINNQLIMGQEVIMPTQEMIEDSKKCIIDYNNIDSIIKINDAKSSIKINPLEGCDTNINFTLGALGKSYAVNYISRYLLREYKINAGSSTIVFKGNKVDSNDGYYKVGVIDVYNDYYNNKKGTYNFIANLKDTSISTSSGDEQNFKYYDGENMHIYHHIIDPYTGYSNENRLAVTGLCENPFYIDIVTTALMNMNLEETKEFIQRLNGEGINVSLIIQEKTNNGVEYLLYNVKDYKRSYTDDKEYVESISIKEIKLW